MESGFDGDSEREGGVGYLLTPKTGETYWKSDAATLELK